MKVNEVYSWKWGGSPKRLVFIVRKITTNSVWVEFVGDDAGCSKDHTGWYPFSGRLRDPRKLTGKKAAYVKLTGELP